MTREGAVGLSITGFAFYAVCTEFPVFLTIVLLKLNHMVWDLLITPCTRLEIPVELLSSKFHLLQFFPLSCLGLGFGTLVVGFGFCLIGARAVNLSSNYGIRLNMEDLRNAY